jgi:HlyD family secretion protein
MAKSEDIQNPEEDESVFREHVLQRQSSSPEQLDELIDVTKPVDWLALTAIWFVLAFAVLWGVFGSVPTRVTGEGMLFGGGKIVDVEASASARVAHVLTRPGDYVEEGQIIAEIDQAELRERHASLSLKLEESREDRQKLIADHAREARLKLANIAIQQERYSEGIVISKKREAALAEDVKKLRSLVDKGFMTSHTLRQREGELNNEVFRIANARAQIERLNAERIDLSLKHERELHGAEHAVNEALRALAELTVILERDRSLRAPASGRILEMRISPGTMLRLGDRIASVETTGEGLRAVVFLSANQAKNVSPGMKVYLTPATVRREESGTLIGTVKRAASFPTTPEGMRTLLRNDTLVTRFASGAPAYAVEVSLQTDPATISGYRWSSGRGPPVTLSSGTLLSAAITTREQRPVALIVPAFRKLAGLD